MDTNSSLPLDAARGKPSSPSLPEKSLNEPQPSSNPEADIAELFEEKTSTEPLNPDQGQIEAVQEGITRSIIADDQSDNQVQANNDQNNQVVTKAGDLPKPVVDKHLEIKEAPKTISQLGQEVIALEKAEDPEGEELILDDAREKEEEQNLDEPVIPVKTGI